MLHVKCAQVVHIIQNSNQFKYMLQVSICEKFTRTFFACKILASGVHNMTVNCHGHFLGSIRFYTRKGHLFRNLEWFKARYERKKSNEISNRKFFFIVYHKMETAVKSGFSNLNRSRSNLFACCLSHERNNVFNFNMATEFLVQICHYLVGSAPLVFSNMLHWVRNAHSSCA